MRWWVLTVSNRRPTPCKGAALPTELSTPSNVYQFKASFRPLPGRNFGTLAFLILIAAPVRGLRPVRAARLPTAKVPKPTRETVPPFFKVVRTAPMVASRARPAAAFDRSACLAMCSINSVLFTKNLWVLMPWKTACGRMKVPTRNRAGTKTGHVCSCQFIPFEYVNKHQPKPNKN